jgi:hypothetical protein
MDPRKSLIWHATKAKKANLIDHKQLEVIRRLCKEASTPDSDLKLASFSQSFLSSLVQKDPTFVISASTAVDVPSAAPSSAMEALPQSVLSAEVAKFLTNDDLLRYSEHIRKIIIRENIFIYFPSRFLSICFCYFSCFSQHIRVIKWLR